MQSVKMGRTVSLVSKLSRAALGSSSSGQLASVSTGLRAMTTANLNSQPVVIRIPRRVQERIESLKQMQGKKFDKLPTVKPGRLLIKSKNPQLNQSVGYTLGKFEQPVLTSKGWKSNRALGDYFSINSIQSAPPFVPKHKDEGDDGASASKKTFHCFNLCPELVETFRDFQRGKTNVLVCTDIASRGLDTQRVGLIVNYDFPESQTDYIHRAGRVGRAGGSEGGEVLSFVTQPWDVELVQKIETAARRRTSLPGMETDIQKPSQTTDAKEV